MDALVVFIPREGVSRIVLHGMIAWLCLFVSVYQLDTSLSSRKEGTACSGQPIFFNPDKPEEGLVDMTAQQRRQTAIASMKHEACHNIDTFDKCVQCGKNSNVEKSCQIELLCTEQLKEYDSIKSKAKEKYDSQTAGT